MNRLYYNYYRYKYDYPQRSSLPPRWSGIGSFKISIRPCPQESDLDSVNVNVKDLSHIFEDVTREADELVSSKRRLSVDNSHHQHDISEEPTHNIPVENKLSRAIIDKPVKTSTFSNGPHIQCKPSSNYYSSIAGREECNNTRGTNLIQRKSCSFSNDRIPSGILTNPRRKVLRPACTVQKSVSFSLDNLSSLKDDEAVVGGIMGLSPKTRRNSCKNKYRPIRTKKGAHLGISKEWMHPDNVDSGSEESHPKQWKDVQNLSRRNSAIIYTSIPIAQELPRVLETSVDDDFGELQAGQRYWSGSLKIKDSSKGLTYLDDFDSKSRYSSRTGGCKDQIHCRKKVK